MILNSAFCNQPQAEFPEAVFDPIADGRRIALGGGDAAIAACRDG